MLYKCFSEITNTHTHNILRNKSLGKLAVSEHKINNNTKRVFLFHLKGKNFCFLISYKTEPNPEKNITRNKTIEFE